MQNEKCSNKTLRVCGAGGVRKNKGKWQAVVTVADEMNGKKVQRTRNTRVPCLKQSARGKAAAMRVLAEFRSEVELDSPRPRRRGPLSAPGFPPNSGMTTPRCRFPRRSRSSSTSAWR